MSLDFRLGTIKDYETVCYRDRGDGMKEMNQVTHTLIWATILVNIGKLETDADCIAFHERLAMYEQLFGTFLFTADEQPQPRPITLDDVRAHRGLTTNVFPRWSDTKWNKHICGIWQQHCQRERNAAQPNVAA